MIALFEPFSYLQVFLEEHMAENKLAFYSYLSYAEQFSPHLDVTFPYLMSLMLDRRITIITVQGSWNSDNSDIVDIAVCYSKGNFIPLKVGNYVYVSM